MPFVEVTVVQTAACVFAVTCSFHGAEKSWFGRLPRPLAAFISKWIGSTKRGVVAELTNDGSVDGSSFRKTPPLRAARNAIRPEKVGPPNISSPFGCVTASCEMMFQGA